MAEQQKHIPLWVVPGPIFAFRRAFSWPDSTFERCMNIIAWIFGLGVISLACYGFGFYGLLVIPFGLVAGFLAGSLAYLIDTPHRRKMQWFAQQQAIREGVPQPVASTTPPVDTNALAQQIVSGFPIPQHLHYLFLPCVKWLLEDASSVPGWDVEKVKRVITNLFQYFIRELKSQYPLPDHPTPLSVPLMQVAKHISPAGLTLSSSDLPLFPRVKRIEDRKWDRWRETDPNTLSDEQQMDYWLGGTQMFSIFYSRVPFELPRDQRFAGLLISIPSQGGKTNLLNGLVREHLSDVAEGRASVIIMDSKSEPTENLIDRWRNVDFAAIDPRLGGRLAVFDPENDIQLNLLEGDITDVIERIEYVFSSILDSKTTPLQGTLLRSIIFLAKATPNPSVAMLFDILRRGWQPYATYVKKLPPEDQDFFNNQFDTRTYADTKNQILWRLKDLTDRAPALRGTLRATSTRVSLRDLIDGGNIIIINAKTHPSEPGVPLLGEVGSAFWRKLWIAELLRAARTRKKRIPVYFYCDEAARALDEKIASIIDECRSSLIATTISFQGQLLDDPKVTAALNRCAIVLKGEGKPGHFKATIRGAGEFDLVSVLTNVRALPQLTKEQAADLKGQMRRRYGPDASGPQSPPEEPPQPPRPQKEGPIIDDAQWEDVTPPQGGTRRKFLARSKKDDEPDPTKPAQH